MKLLIKDKYFKQIEAGKKNIDYRDAHITFVNEDTKKELVRNVIYVWMIDKKNLPSRMKRTKLFNDEKIICFMLDEGE